MYVISKCMSIVYAIIMCIFQGREDDAEWVTSYKVFYSDDGVTFRVYIDTNFASVCFYLFCNYPFTAVQLSLLCISNVLVTLLFSMKGMRLSFTLPLSIF